jgi:DNA mismatch repair protein PMS2
MIKPIERCLVEKIASGQVVTDLSSALKELIENSIDAESTLIGIVNEKRYNICPL